jgi:hypothetical protein
MIDLSTLSARLRTLVPEFARVAGVADLAAAKNAVLSLPAAYIMPGSETASPSSLIGRHTQKVTERFTILIVAKNVSDQSGMAAQSEIAVLSGKVRDALLGWQPTASHAPVELFGAGPLELANQLLYWPEGFQVSTTITA